PRTCPSRRSCRATSWPRGTRSRSPGSLRCTRASGARRPSGTPARTESPRVLRMSSSDFPWEPPLAGTELQHLVGALDRLRTTFRWKADDLDAAGLRTRIGASSLTLGGLLKHLAFVEDFQSTVKLSGTAPGEPWNSVDWDADPEWPF